MQTENEYLMFDEDGEPIVNKVRIEDIIYQKQYMNWLKSCEEDV